MRFSPLPGSNRWQILGMGDLLGLIEQVERDVDMEEAKKLAEKVKKGKGFDLEDLRSQIQQMRNAGGIASMLEKLPGVAELPKERENAGNDKELARTEAIINSMTPQERHRPSSSRDPGRSALRQVRALASKMSIKF